MCLVASFLLILDCMVYFHLIHSIKVFFYALGIWGIDFGSGVAHRSHVISLLQGREDRFPSHYQYLRAGAEESLAFPFLVSGWQI